MRIEYNTNLHFLWYCNGVINSNQIINSNNPHMFKNFFTINKFTNRDGTIVYSIGEIKKDKIKDIINIFEQIKISDKNNIDGTPMKPEY